jgi:membrane protein insertase Oxa1/YidC/SpoIIIJ
VNMTSTTTLIWNRRGLALDIATCWYSRGFIFCFNPMEYMQFCHSSLMIRAEVWNKSVLIMLYWVSNNILCFALIWLGGHAG